MTAPDVEINVGFSSPVGVVDLASGGASISISRGRSDLLNTDISTGTAVVNLRNEDRTFDPLHASSPYFGKMVPGRGIEVVAAGVTIYTGFVEDWNLDYDVSGRSTASVSATDALGILARSEFAEWTSSATSADGKLDAICDRPEIDWNAGLRDFDTGLELLTSHTVAAKTNALGYAQQVATSDQGFFFAAADGKLTFRSRLARYAAASVTFGGSSTFTATLLDDAGDPLLDELGDPLTAEFDAVQFQTVAATLGSELLFARVIVEREGGVPQIATVASPSTWEATYGPLRSYTLPETLLSNDGRSLAIANYLLGLYEAPAYRISQVGVQLATLTTAEQQSVLEMDIGSVVEVRYTPNGVGSEIQQSLFVQGITHDIQPASHFVTFSLVDAYTLGANVWDVGQWDVAEWQ